MPGDIGHFSSSMGLSSTALYLLLAALRVAAMIFGLGMLPGIWVLWRARLKSRALEWAAWSALLIAYFFLMPTLVRFLEPKIGDAKPEGLWTAYIATGFFLVLLLPEPLRRARFLASRKENSHGERRKRRKRVRTSDSPPAE
jgi:hypothetical protein